VEAKSERARCPSRLQSVYRRRVLELPRATYYRGIKPSIEADMSLRDSIQQIALE